MGRFAQRWWDGAQWTDHVSNGDGATAVDPTPIAVPATPVQAPAALQPQPVYSPTGLVAGPQTPGYGLPGGGAWAAPQQIAIANVSKSPGLAVASLVLGVGAFFFSLLPFVGLTSVPFAICGIALGIAGVARANKGYEGRGLSITGVVGGLAALLVSFVYIFAIGDAVNSIDDSGYNTDTIDGFCNVDRIWEDPDC
jgi:hypothetical protein